MWILQISDIHKCTTLSLKKQAIIIDSIHEVIKKEVLDEKLLVVVCGDITNKGRADGYKDSLFYLSNFAKRMQGTIEDFCFCPGNHDIIHDVNDFTIFNGFLWKFTKTTGNYFNDNTVVKYCKDNIDIVLLNSAYHFDYTYGKLNIEEIEDCYKSCKGKFKITVMHHHLIPTMGKDKSNIANAYEYLLLLDKYDIGLVLHGHQHKHMYLNIGTKVTPIIGVGSLVLPIDKSNINNQFILIKIDDNRITQANCFRAVADLNHLGSAWGWMKTTII